jgi:ubiquinone/menaquinone biosynthesis C-methylase UbiE
MTVRLLKQCVGVRQDDVILEIGAGVGRVGAVLAPLCREWIGADVSENMVDYIQRRLQAFDNVRTVVLNGYDLSNIESDSVDLVYCTVVFMHLEEWERYGYVREGLRVLREGGRMLVDNINLVSNEGWALFEQHFALPPSERPPHISKPSTPQELEAYFRHAGFTAIEQAENGLWIVTYGVKPRIN